ncbi:hypothetical protein SGPA1_10061 [Streptomyces misionensis JCM 4497]
MGLGGRGPVRALRRPRARRGHQRLSDLGRPLLHGRPARRAPLGLVHGLAESARPARRDRRDRLRRRAVHRRVRPSPVGFHADARPDDADLLRHPPAARGAEPVRRPRGQPAQLGQRLVAPGGCRAHRRRPRDRARPPPLAVLRVHHLRQRDRLVQPLVRGGHRAAARPVHLLRLRRLRAPVGGDLARLGVRGQGHRPGHLGVLAGRFRAAGRADLRHPGLRRDPHHRHRGAAGPDPAGRPRRGWREGAAAGGDRGPAVLRERGGRRGQPDGVRVQPGRRAARLPAVAHGQPAHTDPGGRRLAVGRRGRGPRAAVAVLGDGVQRGHRHQRHRHHPRLRHPGAAAAAGRGPVPAGALAPGPVEQARRLGRGALGGVRDGAVLSAAVLAGHRRHHELRGGGAGRRAAAGQRLVVRRPPLLRHPHRGLRQRPRPGRTRGGHHLIRGRAGARRPGGTPCSGYGRMNARAGHRSSGTGTFAHPAHRAGDNVTRPHIRRSAGTRRGGGDR